MADGGMQLSSQTVQQLHKVFIQFCSFGAGQRGDDRMDSAKFQKFNKDMNLMTKNPAGSRSITRTDLDLIFTRVKAKGERKIDFNVFLEALYQIAETKRTPFMKQSLLCLLLFLAGRSFRVKLEAFEKLGAVVSMFVLPAVP